MEESKCNGRSMTVRRERLLNTTQTTTTAAAATAAGATTTTMTVAAAFLPKKQPKTGKAADLFTVFMSGDVRCRR